MMNVNQRQPAMDSTEVLAKLSQLIEATLSASEKATFHTTNCQALANLIKQLLPLLDEVQESEVPIMGGAVTSFEGLQSAILKAKKLIERCGRETSQLYVVLRSEKFVQKFKLVALELEAQVSSLPLGALQLTETTRQQVEKCILELHETTYKQETEVDLSKDIEAVLKELKEGKKIGHERLADLSLKFNLRLNQEILREASLLEKERENARMERDKVEEDFINQLLVLVTKMGDDLAEQKQAQLEFGGIPVPADFRCPLSLELMSDPVIVASGQTYERSYIQKWLDQGNTTCPKTRQTLNHTNLIPNYTVKALIANWCEANSVPFPEPIKVQSVNGQSVATPTSSAVKSRPTDNGQMLEHGARDTHVTFIPGSRPSERTLGSNLLRFLDEREAVLGRAGSSGEGHAVNQSSSRAISGGNINGKLLASIPRKEEPNAELLRAHSGNTSSSSSADDALFSAAFDDSNVEAAQKPIYSSSSSSTSGGDSGHPALSTFRTPDQVVHGSIAPVNIDRVVLASPRRDRSSDFSGSTISSPSNSRTLEIGENDTQANISQLVEDLQSSCADIKRNAATSLRLLSKHSMDNRIHIANCGAIRPLVSLLNSTDTQTQENAVTALLNLSINDSNKNEIAAANAIVPLVNVLKEGSAEAKENSAATLFSLSVMDENKIAIGQSGAIPPLVDLLMYGRPRGKKDAATALFNLSIHHENKAKIVAAGAVRPLVELMADPAAGMVDKAVAVLGNLATIPEGRGAIGEQGGIPALVEVVELGSQRGKENAAAALLQLCTNNHRFRAMVLQEGAIPPLVALSQSGTPRAKEKASALLRHFREQRQAVLGRGGPERHMDHRQFARPYG